MASLYQINTSDGGVPKIPVDEAEIGINGIVGDRQADLEHHGGLDRALCLFSLEVIEALRAEGNEIGPGTTGENLTITGLEWELVKPGTRLRIGQAVAQVTSYTTPCAKIAASFSDGISARIHPAAHPGWSRAYARVIIGGVIRSGDDVELID
ncbi:MAG: MOSC domain-containing protein [Acidimicrobiia bacterium]|nr:MOSC domain-containing protein [Acidimicrobiia bacterium]